ncbi:MAG: type II/IV secretion system protein, partial [Sulfurimonas sp.]|nr:type II/IV secretion system protein [Sulfurimonas sp.]
IRYAQHLAMVDDKFGDNDGGVGWFEKRWQLIFQTTARTDNKLAYTIYSDTGSVVATAKPDSTEIAMDPLNNNKYLSGGTTTLYTLTDEKVNKKMNLGLSYGIDSMLMSGGCNINNKRLSFDHLGRPIANSLATYSSAYKASGSGYLRLLSSPCIITLTSPSEGSIEIHIEQETGYAHIVHI